MNHNAFKLKSEYFDFDSRWHGIEHTYNVMSNVLKLGALLNDKRETNLAFCAAFIHDMARKDDGYCTMHGEWASEKKLDKFSEFFISQGVASKDFPIIKTAVKWHSLTEELDENHPHYFVTSILKDADALDRVRFGVDALDVNYLRFKESITLVL